MENTFTFTPKEQQIRFYRFIGARSCRIEAEPTDGGYRLLVVGDYIPTIEDRIVAADVLYSEAEKILTEWFEIAKARVRRQYGEGVI